MKQKTQPFTTSVGNYLEQAVMDGLSNKGKIWAKNKIKEWEDSGQRVPYGLIRSVAKQMHPLQKANR